MKFNTQITISHPYGIYEQSEDTMLLIKILKIKKGINILDMGTGTGIVALHCANSGAIVIAVDVDPKAVDCARKNAIDNDIKMKVVRSDLFRNVFGKFDVIAFNPPYLPSDDDGADSLAWTGGLRGTELFDRFLRTAKKHMKPNGVIYTLISTLSMQDDIYSKMKEYNYSVKIIDKHKSFFETIYGVKLFSTH